MLEPDNPHTLLEWARDLGKTHAFIDLHVHPYEVLSGDTGFTPDPQAEGLFMKGLFHYQPPKLENGMESIYNSCNSPQPTLNNQRAILLAARLLYNHTGPKVFADQLDLAGLSGALLLPVARTVGQSEEMLEASHEMFPTNERFHIGCAFPIGIQPEKINSFFHSAYNLNGIRAIKFHPNLAGINPLTQKGQELMYACLTVAGELNLPMVVHGGRSPGLEPACNREYGTIARLAMLNWSISTAPVILAHAGCYGLTHTEAIEALILLNNLLKKHSNLMVDMSNLEPPILQLVLEKIDPHRIVFGSDALYVPIWKAWIRFLQTLQLISAHPDDDLICIASLNPARCLSLLSTH